MADQIVRVITSDGAVMASAITGKELVEQARQIHKTLPGGHCRSGAVPDGGVHDGQPAQRGEEFPDVAGSRAVGRWG